MSSEPEQFALKPQVFGRYCLLERLSMGGMAEIFKARPFYAQDLRRYLVVKRILPHLANDEEFITMFVDEARLTIELSHPNVCQLYELGQLDGSYYIVMEYIAGRDVLSIINWFRKNRSFLTTELVAFIVAEICAGLDYAHKKRVSGGTSLNVVHRDISPQNVLVGYDGSVKVIDFGIARAASRRQRTEIGVLKGKFGYMSPEQVRGEDLDRRSDVFATGILFWEMLTARRLFYAKNEYDILDRVKNMDVPPPSSINADVPPELDEIVAKALVRDRDERYQWAGEMEADLRAWLARSGRSYDAGLLAKWMSQAYGDELRSEHKRNEDFDAFQRPRDVVVYLQETEQEVPEELKGLEVSGIRISEEELTRLETKVTSARFQVIAEASNAKVPALMQRNAPRQLRRSKTSRGLIAAIITVAALIAILGSVLAFSSGSLVGVRAGMARLEISVPEEIENAVVKLDELTITPLIDENGRRVWLAPNLVVGQHTLSVSAEGYVTVNQAVLVQEGQSLPINVTLQPVDPAYVAIRVVLPTGVDGLKVAINGERVESGEDPEVMLGRGDTFVVDAAAPGYVPARVSVDRNVKSGVFVLDLKRITPQLRISSEGVALVQLGGEEVGDTTESVVLTGLDPWSVHRFTIVPTETGFQTQNFDFAFEGNFQRQIHVPPLRMGLETRSFTPFGTLRFVGDEFYMVRVCERAPVGQGPVECTAAQEKLPVFATSVGARDLGLAAGEYVVRLMRGKESLTDTTFSIKIEPGRTESIRLPTYVAVD